MGTSKAVKADWNHTLNLVRVQNTRVTEAVYSNLALIVPYRWTKLMCNYYRGAIGQRPYTTVPPIRFFIYWAKAPKLILFVSDQGSSISEEHDSSEPWPFKYSNLIKVQLRTQESKVELRFRKRIQKHRFSKISMMQLLNFAPILIFAMIFKETMAFDPAPVQFAWRCSYFGVRLARGYCTSFNCIKSSGVSLLQLKGQYKLNLKSLNGRYLKTQYHRLFLQ